MPELAGRDGLSNAQLVALWPMSPNQSCSRCHAGHVLVTWTLDEGALCAGCLEGFRDTTTEGTR